MEQINKKNHYLICYFFTLISFTNIQAQEFIIGVEDVSYYPLFEFKSNRNTHSRELLDTFAAAKGYKFIYLPLPIKRFQSWLIEDKIDLKYPDNSRWYADVKATDKFIFSKSTIKLVAGTSVLKSSLKKNKSEFKSIGTLLGFYPTHWIAQIKSGQVKLYEDVSTKILVQQLVAGHIDGIDIEPSVIHYYLEELGKPSDTSIIDRRYEYDVYDFHFSTIKHPEIIKEFNKFLKNNKPLLEKLNKKYKIIDYRPYLK
jgi:ABC-type amino acid transport substrate-binding protein